MSHEKFGFQRLTKMKKNKTTKTTKTRPKPSWEGLLMLKFDVDV
jgi:hypothetical protein